MDSIVPQLTPSTLDQLSSSSNFEFYSLILKRIIKIVNGRIVPDESFEIYDDTNKFNLLWAGLHETRCIICPEIYTSTTHQERAKKCIVGAKHLSDFKSHLKNVSNKLTLQLFAISPNQVQIINENSRLPGEILRSYNLSKTRNVEYFNKNENWIRIDNGLNRCNIFNCDDIKKCNGKSYKKANFFDHLGSTEKKNGLLLCREEAQEIIDQQQQAMINENSIGSAFQKTPPRINNPEIKEENESDPPNNQPSLSIQILDREQGGYENLKSLDINVHSLIKISKLFDNLIDEKLLEKSKSDKILDFISKNLNITISDIIKANYEKLNENKEEKTIALTYGERAKLTDNKVSKYLFELMEKKKSNLCVAIDENKKSKILNIVEQVASNVVMIKLHCDIIDDFDQDFVNKLKELAKKYQFLVFEDRKFADIGNTVKDQFNHGLYKISEWADIVNCHVISGEGIISSLKSSADLEKTGCLIVAELSCKGNLITSSYTNVAVKFAENHSEFVIGFISQSKVSLNQKFLHLTPGVNIKDSNDEFDQNYTSPTDAIKKKGADIIIVGRGISKSEEPAKISKNYQLEAFKAYEELI